MADVGPDFRGFTSDDTDDEFDRGDMLTLGERCELCEEESDMFNDDLSALSCCEWLLDNSDTDVASDSVLECTSF